jgi:5-methylcytosine-specific restriction endonuclease McrA
LTKINDKYDTAKRQAVYDRDRVCRLCGKRAGNVHHIIYRSHGGNNSEKNLIALCQRCHAKVHSNGKEWRPRLIKMQELIYGHIDERELKKQDRYKNFAYSKFRR